jgi:hypothetical protein
MKYFSAKLGKSLFTSSSKLFDKTIRMATEMAGVGGAGGIGHLFHPRRV